MVSISKITVHDLTSGTDTDTLLSPAGGGVLYLSDLPKLPNLKIEFSAPIAKAYFYLDGQLIADQQWSAPYCYPAKTAALVPLAIGPHTFTWAVDAQPKQTINFTVARAPTPPGPPASAGTFGTNLTGFNDPANDPELHPILSATARALDMLTIRLWLTGTIGTPFKPTDFAIVQKWLDLGFSVILIINFQNTRGHRCQAPADSDWLATVNSLPNFPHGKVFIEIGNELDTTCDQSKPQIPDDVYWLGSLAQYAHLLAQAYAPLKEKGCLVIAGNTLRSINYLIALNAIGALQNCDAIGTHFYDETSDECLARIDALIAFAGTSHNVICTEGCPRTTSPLEIQKLKQALKSREGLFCFFPLRDLPTDTLDTRAPLTADLKQSPWCPAYKS